MAKRVEGNAVSELKKELQSVVEALVEEEDDDDDDDCNLTTTDSAIQMLSALKELKLKQSTDQEFVEIKNLVGFQEPPPEFRCPISGLLMKDPVVLASGQTYEEQYITGWLKDGHQKCPKTDQPLPHTLLIPNHSIKKMVMNWCKLHNFDMPRTSPPADDEYAATTNNERLVQLLDCLSSSSASDAAKELRLLTSRSPSFRALFGEITGAIPQLFSPLLLDKAYSDARLHDDLVATVLNVSAHESNNGKILASGNPLAVSFLIDSLRSKNVETRSHAAAVISALSALDMNKDVIGESGAIKPLVDLIAEGEPLALNEAANAILNLCTVIENRERAISEGAVVAVVDKIVGRVLIDEMLAILATLSCHQWAVEEMDEHGMILCLFEMLRENSISEQSKEHCVAIIYVMCFSDRTKLRKIREVDDAYETLRRVARTGTSRAKRKASSILERLNRFAFVSHTA
ncbi:U-box domain-containing protein 9 [Sesamum alatum]|uniref:RING-type E3 ubiquitin transferase n=1 Tax=Sesamum alatum TaxID=300844 RepID=A0AAE2CVX0_9LAMI|nr:U-box domain-containing protein 9 [Sesamum alatum]